MKNSNLILIGFVLIGMIFFQSCEHDNSLAFDELDQVSYDKADAINGARLYDKFWATKGYYSPIDPNVQQNDIEDYSEFYRCSQCHGWDLKAREGAYINRSPNTFRPNISESPLWGATQNIDIKELFIAIQHKGGASVDPNRTADGRNTSLGGDIMPDFSKILTTQQIWDLVKFIKEGSLDTEQLYDLEITGSYPTATVVFANLGKDGNATTGDTYYVDNCASCHGADGTDFLMEDATLTLGKFARQKPYKFQHKTKFGTPTSHIDEMVGVNDATIDDMKNLLKALTDINKYPDQGASQGAVSYSADIQPFFDAKCISCHGSAGGISLVANVSYNNLVSGGYINTASPSSSLIYTSLLGTMSNYANITEKQMVLQWITEGALNN